MLLRGAVVAGARIGERGAGALQADPVEPGAGRVEGGVDAGELLLGHDIGAEAPFDLAQTVVVRFLEGLEGGGKVIDGRADRAGLGGLVLKRRQDSLGFQGLELETLVSMAAWRVMGKPRLGGG